MRDSAGVAGDVPSSAKRSSGLIVPPVITIQPLVPERLPCYDFRPVVYYPWMSLDNFRYSLLPARDRQLVDLEALISP